MIADAIDLIFSLLTMFLSILPASFVQSYLKSFGGMEYLSYINWFIPFYRFVQIGETWLLCCGAYLIFYYVRSVREEMKNN